MKKIIAVATALVASVALVGTAVPANAVVPALTKKDKQFVKIVKREAPDLRSVGASLLVKTAKTTCKTLDAGYDVLDVIELGEDSGLDTDTVITLTAAAVVFYCPRHKIS